MQCCTAPTMTSLALAGRFTAERASFAALVARRIVSGVGHFLPREKPDAVSSALLELMAATR